jgi:hypothetical protein
MIKSFQVLRAVSIGALFLSERATFEAFVVIKSITYFAVERG